MYSNAIVTNNASYISRTSPASATHAGVSELIIGVNVLAVEPGRRVVMIRIFSRQQSHKDR